MNYGLLVYEPIRGIVNMGDYIQSLAAKQFINDKPAYINREQLNSYDGKEVILILNGWFMHFPYNFPPSSRINPFFISFHLNYDVCDVILNNDNNIAYFKRYEPIGCRDMYTLEKFTKKGIIAYFSGCLTLTLGMSYKQTKQRENIYIVDPHIDYSIINYFSIISFFIKNYKKIYQISKNKYNDSKLTSMISSALFYRQYNAIWTDEILLNAEFIEHYVRYNSHDDHFVYADELLRKYSNAKLIITSRIHVALPAAGMNTPCIFVKPLDQSSSNKSRMEGIIDFLNVVVHTGYKIENNNKIDVLNPKTKFVSEEIKNKLLLLMEKLPK